MAKLKVAAWMRDEQERRKEAYRRLFAGQPLERIPIEMHVLAPTNYTVREQFQDANKQLEVALASALHTAKNFADILVLTLKLLSDAQEFAATPLATEQKKSKRRKKSPKRSKHDPRRTDPTVVSEEAFVKARQRAPLEFWFTLLLILSDGKPHDIDLYEGRYGIEDTRMALIEAREAGLKPFCVTIDREGANYLPHLFGPAGYTIVRKPGDLPDRLPLLYAQLTGNA